MFIWRPSQMPASRCVIRILTLLAIMLPLSLAWPPSSSGAVLEDFATLRLNGDGLPLWAPYTGPSGNANQVGTFVGDGTYRIDVGAILPGSSNAYLQFLPRS